MHNPLTSPSLTERLGRWGRRLVFIIATVIIVPLAVLNRQDVTFNLSPLGDYQFDVPLFILLMLVFLSGTIIGFGLAWIRR